jgi:hypothetical protein
MYLHFGLLGFCALSIVQCSEQIMITNVVGSCSNTSEFYSECAQF